MNYIGYFGKLPAKGDFILHGMEIDERDAWDAWLQEGLVSARESLADGWAASYVYRSVWRFFFSEQGAARSGVLLFSHDHVGREFPFVALFGEPMDPASVPNLAVGDIDTALSFAERLVASAYEGRVPVEQLATLLQSVPWRRSVPGTLSDSDGSIRSYAPGTAAHPLSLEAVVLHYFIGDVSTKESHSLWWRCGENGMLERAVVSGGPLSRGLFCRLLDASVPASDPPATAPDVDEPAVGGNASSRTVSGVGTDPGGNDPVDFDSLLG